MFPKVLWIAPTDTHAARLTDWLTALDPDAQGLFQVGSDTSFPAAIASALGGDNEVTS